MNETKEVIQMNQAITKALLAQLGVKSLAQMNEFEAFDMFCVGQALDDVKTQFNARWNELNPAEVEYYQSVLQ
jgi:hypothetical protein